MPAFRCCAKLKQDSKIPGLKSLQLHTADEVRRGTDKHINMELVHFTVCSVTHVFLLPYSYMDFYPLPVSGANKDLPQWLPHSCSVLSHVFIALLDM